MTTQFSLEYRLPSTEWLIENLDLFVRAEFSEHPGQAANVPKVPQVETTEYLPDGFLEQFLESSEWSTYSFNESFSGSPEGMASAVYRLLCNPRVGSKRNAYNNTERETIDKLVPAISRNSRLLFVLPGFPFKDQNLFRVPYEASHPDLADISFIIRLHRLTQALYQVHPFGADILVLTDGDLYADIFDVKRSDVEAYGRRLASYRNLLNLQGTVSFYSLHKLIMRSPADAACFWQVVADIESWLEDSNERVERTTENLKVLRLGMRRNMQTRERLGSLSHGEAWHILWGNADELGSPHRGLREELDRRVEAAASRYAAVNLALKWTKLIDRWFPDAIRGTVHAKPGQFALAGSGGAYAWNGVAWSNESHPSSIDEIEVKPFSSLGSGQNIRQFLFHNGAPAFYTRGDV
ncbi:L-tyrosine/L-tryptophan isonitrile synthase family protein (plasmid) [Paenarthrobacter ureafaciens]